MKKTLIHLIFLILFFLLILSKLSAQTLVATANFDWTKKIPEGSIVAITDSISIISKTGNSNISETEDKIIIDCKNHILNKGLSVVERERLNSIIKEQGLCKSGLCTPEAGELVGHLTGATHILYLLIILNTNLTINYVSYELMDTKTGKIIETKYKDFFEPTSEGTYIDSRDGHAYKWVKIGTQKWMTGNLAYKASSGCWAYNNDQSNVAVYGYLYNWEMAKEVCPLGWHLPSDADWTTLVNYLGGEEFAGYKLKSTTGWNSPNAGANNSSGFSALPGGENNEGKFNYIGSQGCWWTSTPDAITNDSWFLFMTHISNGVYRLPIYETSGVSVRCIKDK